MPAAVREAASSTTSQSGIGGKCGWQHNYTSCLPVEGKSLCCSINGYCGSNATFCTDGCQENCWLDPSVLSSGAPSSTIPQGTTTPRTSITTISSATQSASPNTTTAQHHGLSGSALAGTIAGSAIGGLVFIGLLIACIIFLRRGRSWKTAKSGQSSPVEDIELPEPTAYHDGPIAPSNIHLRNYGE
ncbi:hypothetical protein F5882DRAFT_419215 [Hyaloscypha sp. PMI_1271]|nr:hypothetical protein F5882DRAFT_419215 [Hyaloscypha sp. PMI_1271]